MKQYTNTEQTAKLIELGLEPRTRIPFEVCNNELGRTFSIGELIEMLNTDNIEINRYSGDWSVDIDYIGARNKELIDALYEMVVKLKEEDVI